MKDFTRDDLKQGMVCELRNGSMLTILNNTCYYKESEKRDFALINNYNDDLTHRRQKDYDIIKVTFGNETIYERQEPKTTWFEPKENEEYYYSFEGYVGSTNRNHILDEFLINSQQVFQTREEAEKELLKQQAKIRVIKEIARLNDGWDVREHWGSFDTWKFYIVYNDRASRLMIRSASNFKTLDNNLYLKTRELAEQLIETHKDDLLIYFEAEQ